MTMTCFTDWKFIKAGRYGQAKKLLKHLENRDDIHFAAPDEPWFDYGLGGDWQAIIDTLIELESAKVLLRSLVIRPPQKLIAQLQEIDPERWGARFELLAELVERVMDAEMDRAGIAWLHHVDPIDLPYSFVIHTHPDKDGVESPHAHVIVPAMEWHRDRFFNVYPDDAKLTRAVAEQEAEQLFRLDRLRERSPEVEGVCPK